jgi:hypothetical protein
MRQGNKYDKILVCKYLGQADDLAAGLKYSSESLQIQGLQQIERWMRQPLGSRCQNTVKLNLERRETLDRE